MNVRDLMSMVSTTIALALFVAMVARRHRQARMAALEAQNNDTEAAVLKPLETCRAILVKMPDGDILAGCPPEPDAACNV